MNDQIELMMKQVKLGGMAKNWRDITYKDNEQYVYDLLALEIIESASLNGKRNYNLRADGRGKISFKVGES